MRYVVQNANFVNECTVDGKKMLVYSDPNTNALFAVDASHVIDNNINVIQNPYMKTAKKISIKQKSKA